MVQTVAVTETLRQEELPFENQWNYFLDNGAWVENPDDYLKVMKKLCSVSTIQDFWRYLNGMKQSMFKIMSQASPEFSLRMFRSDTKPIWEDTRNTFGGRWVIHCSTLDHVSIWSLWQEMLMCVAGESFCRKDAVCGCVLYFRSNGRKELHLWVDSIPADFEREKQFLSSLLSTDALHFRAHDKTVAKIDSRAVRTILSVHPEEPSVAVKSSFISLKPHTFRRESQSTPPLSPQTSPSLSPQTTPSLSPQTTPAFSIRMLSPLVPCS